MRTFLISLFILLTINTYSQHRKKTNPVFHEVNNKEVVQLIFPTASKVEKVNDFWFKIIDNKEKTIGFAMSSTSFCKDIIGYSNNTPVLIITDLKFIIKKTALLSNWETPSYVKKLENYGFFNLWNGKTLKKAKSIQIDGYTGATLTAKAVNENVKFLLENGSKKIPKK